MKNNKTLEKGIEFIKILAEVPNKTNKLIASRIYKFLLKKKFTIEDLNCNSELVLLEII